MTVRIVTDSTCDLPRDLVTAYNIVVVPLTVFFGEEAFLDGVEIEGDEFYERMASSKVLPRTSQPSVEQFREAYEKLAEETDEIVSIHLSSRLSGTLNAASVAREDLAGQVHIDLIDSYTVSLGLALVVLEAAAVAAKGGTLDAVVAAARRAMDRVSVRVVVDTLEYLQKGGRIGRAQSLLGSVLSIKPLLHVEDGEVAPFERVRTRTKAFERMVEIASQQARAKMMFVACGGNDAEGERFIDAVRPNLPHTDIGLARLGPVVGVYTGPNALGFAWINRE
jgi:DegV family protein with EDD domain